MNRGRPVKAHCCTVCGETDPDKFYPSNKSLCRIHHSERAALRQRLVRQGEVPVRHRLPSVRPIEVCGASAPPPASTDGAVLTCRCGNGIFNVPEHLMDFATWVCGQCAVRGRT